MKRKRIAYVIAGALLVAAGGIYFYYGFLFKEARSIESEMPERSIAATKLIADYTADPQKADSLYLNKTIEITGLATKKTDSAVVLENSVFCVFNKEIKNKPISKNLTVKGKCIGYDELFEEVKLDQCTINK
ncbi:OB-fold protein [Flavobacterium sp. HJJ]|uniref:OB-fold protein n=1 Tax=Flavobacterium sp. HJJ TaxID=2783792 RepID=UPI00188C6FC8|nr:hypothetical protein [Flavobacterium sp. HJJ]MBF4471524.1 hypothetical protein [Flavobacterium sp. HJJ]